MFFLFLLFILIISDEIVSVFMTEISRCYKDARKRMKLEARSKTEEKNERIKKKKGKEESKIDTGRRWTEHRQEDGRNTEMEEREGWIGGMQEANMKWK